MNHPEFVATFARDVRAGLTATPQKRLPCQYLYDDLGSLLFDALCLLPEYGLSRAGARLLAQYGTALAHHLRAPLRIVELGSGSGQKTRLLLQTLATHFSGEKLRYMPVDISGGALKSCMQQAAELPAWQVTPLECDYEAGLAQATASRMAHEQVLVLFLGSTIGNFERADGAAFLRHLRSKLQPGDLLLLATDLAKPVEVMESAYDDALGVTASFNRNILVHINRVLEGDFQLADFAHEARWNAAHTRVEMHLRARQATRVRIRRAEVDIALAAGETIWTESSHKFTLPMLTDLAHATGFAHADRWVDPAWPFAHNLWRA